MTIQTIVALTKAPHIYDGYMHGYHQPSAEITLQIKSVDTLQLLHLHQAFTYYFAKYPLKINALESMDDLAACFGEGVCLLQRAGGLPIFEDIKINSAAGNEDEFIIYVPMLFSMCLYQVVEFLLNFFNYHLTAAAFVPNQALTTHIETLITNLKGHAPQGTNSLRFLQAAHEENIPWMHVALNGFQYGYGAHARWLDSTYTDKTPQITTILARNKRSMSVLLYNAGFPVADQYVVNSEAEAIEVANRIGYPVVIKPLDQDGGKGVYANLISEQSLKKAYPLARQISPHLILEKHIPGKDYRLLVLNGKLIWAIERIPAGVTGDGVQNIQMLAVQHDQRHASIYPLRHIEITADTINYLAEQNYTLASVPHTGQFIPLSRIANISMGGTPIAVFEKVHPDNKRLAETAAKLLRLDIAGVDFISPNIEQSYLENGGKLIEINSQPQLGKTTAPHIYKQILTTLLPDQKRIPIIVILGKNIEDHVIKKIKQQLLGNISCVGVAKKTDAYLNDEKIISGKSLFQAGRSLLLLNEVEALIYCIEELNAIENHGLPFDRYDNLFLLDASFSNQENCNQTERNSLNTLFKACVGQTTKWQTASHVEEKLYSL